MWSMFNNNDILSNNIYMNIEEKDFLNMMILCHHVKEYLLMLMKLLEH